MYVCHACAGDEVLGRRLGDRRESAPVLVELAFLWETDRKRNQQLRSWVPTVIDARKDVSMVMR